MKIDYQTPQHHVAMRDGLPPAIRPTLLEEAKSDWKAHPRFAGKARFFMNIHRQLLDGTHQIARTLESFLDQPGGDLKSAVDASRLVPAGKRLIGFVHGHHEIEDHGYFPQFALLYPGLENALALLDGDHKVLNEALHGAELALKALSATDVSRDKVAALYTHSAALEKILNRHITDEEEVIIPVFLRHG